MSESERMSSSAWGGGGGLKHASRTPRPADDALPSAAPTNPAPA
eukprot:CAMPEP_0202878386 /NCGR_PEP_ID=MMETSP1391-20130828/32109_1 /ASSEMBLY_ACC=CAM_ASM_000867 /TAXON_ID=1034604 /ORGANISM="Chlamydomonas leiostraca, Strain SAG 11-49" /LENGTH=43 /DNA_ID= /DNA_START= /DNA_END= /DNA_ORIENTATION=